MALLLGDIFKKLAHCARLILAQLKDQNLNQIALGQIYLFPRIQLAIIYSKF